MMLLTEVKDGGVYGGRVIRVAQSLAFRRNGYDRKGLQRRGGQQQQQGEER